MLPEVQKKPGQRSATYPTYLSRYVPHWMHPGWLSAERWRQVVLNQPFCGACRDTIIMNVLTLGYRVTARDPEQIWDFRHDIDWYEKLFRDADDEGYDIHTEKILKDCYDIPFGGCAEVGHKNDNPEGRVAWVRHIDGGTLFPTFNFDFPVVQYSEYSLQAGPIVFPRHSVARTYMSPRTEIIRRGWGMAPPEKIYLALEMLYRGDKYYADLFLDVPEIGILDVMDMDETSAEAWIGSWRDMIQGSDSFKIPILHSHEKPANFISFTRPPTEMIFDKGMARYETILAAGYGLSPTDVGDLSIAASTLAASIRQERRSRRTGVGMGIIKTQSYYNRILPAHLKFELIDRDEESLVAKGRARLANSLAFGNYVDKGVMTQSMALNQSVTDGLITIPIQEHMERLVNAEKDYEVTLPGTEKVTGKQPGTGGPKQQIREGMGDPKPPSGGGEGEINARNVFGTIAKRSLPIHFTRLVNIIRPVLEKRIEQLRSEEVEPVQYIESMFGSKPPEEVSQAREAILRSLTADGWWKMSSGDIRNALGLQDRFTRVALQIRNQLSDAQYITGAERPAFPELIPLPESDIEAFTGQLAETHNDMTAYLLSLCTISRVAHMLFQDAELTDAVEQIRSDFLESLALRGELAENVVREWLVEKHATTLKESDNA